MLFVYKHVKIPFHVLKKVNYTLICVFMQIFKQNLFKKDEIFRQFGKSFARKNAVNTSRF